MAADTTVKNITFKSQTQNYNLNEHNAESTLSKIV